MTALAQARLTKRIGPAYPDFVQGEIAYAGVAASTSIYHGSVVGLNSSGYAGPASATFSNVIGCADLMPTTTGGVVNNSAGSNGDLTIRVRTGVFKFVNSSSTDAITNAWIGKPCFVVDDNIVAKTSSAGTRPVCGIVWFVDSDGVWVQMGPGLGNTSVINMPVTLHEFFAQDAAAGTTTAEQTIALTREAFTVSNISINPTGALTASDSVYATITIATRDGVGGSGTTLATLVTNVASGNWSAFTRKNLTLSTTAIVAGGIITWTVAKASTGTQLPALVAEITGYRY